MDENNRGKRAHAEYLRRNRIGELLEQLASTLPKHLLCKNSRQPDILNAAIKYVKECQNAAEFHAPLTESDAKYVSKIKELQLYIAELESRCDRYAKLLDNSGICKVPHTAEPKENSIRVEQPIVNIEPRQSNIEENFENSSNSVCIGAPIILLVQQRIGGGRRKRIIQTPSAFKIQPLLPKPATSNDLSVESVAPQTSNSLIQVEQKIDNFINPVQNDNFDEQPIIVNIDEEGDLDCAHKVHEDVGVETDPFLIVTCEIECQTEPFLAEVQSKFVDRAASPCSFIDDEQNVSSQRKYPKVNHSEIKNNKPTPKKPRTDAISEIVNFIVDMPDKELSNMIGVPTTVHDKTVQQRSRSNVFCTPSLLRVEDILQPVVGSSSTTGYSNSTVNSASRPLPQNNKRSTTSKSHSKRPEKVEKQSVSASNSSSSWREFLPNFSQIFPSYCPPSVPSTATSATKIHSDVVHSSTTNKRNNTFKNDHNGGNFHHIGADFSIESIQNGFEVNKNRSSTQAQKSAAAAKLSHFPCGSSSNSAISNAPNVSGGMPLPYSEMPMFLPCFPHPPTFNEGKSKSKRSDAVSLTSAVNNPLIPTDGSHEVNLSNSIFDTQGNNCGSFVPPYHTGQPTNFYNFSTSKAPSNNSTAATSDDRVIGDAQSIAWQWSDHGFSSQNYSQSLESIQTSGQKGQNFHIAAMFPEVTTPLSNSTTTHLSPSYRWNEPRLSNEHGNVSSMPSVPPTHHYSSHNEPSSWAPPQLRSYNNHDRTSNSFMPSFNFSQPNSHN